MTFGPLQKRPSDFSRALKSSNFKRGLINFLESEWNSNEYADIVQHRTLYVSFEDKCYKFSASNDKVTREEVQGLHAPNHNEADTKVALHLGHINVNHPGSNIVVRASDTDILVILLYHAVATLSECNIWMDAGSSANNTRRYVDVSSLGMCAELKDSIRSIPGFHALTGTDYTCAFSRKGKVRPFQVMTKKTHRKGKVRPFQVMTKKKHIEKVRFDHSK